MVSLAFSFEKHLVIDDQHPFFLAPAPAAVNPCLPSLPPPLLIVSQDLPRQGISSVVYRVIIFSASPPLLSLTFDLSSPL